MGKFSCEACKKKCKKEAVRLQDKYFHLACFKCKACDKPLATDGFYTKDGNHYCNEDYRRLFGTKCSTCGQVVEGDVITVLGKSYHQDCFCCSKCRKKFKPGEKVTFTNDEHWCPRCVHQEASPATATALVPNKPEEEAPASAGAAAGAAAAVEIPASPPSASEEKQPDLNEKVSSPATPLDSSSLQNGQHKPESPAGQTAEVSATSTAEQVIKKPSFNLPRVFGMPDSKFYNISYLERSSTEFKRGPSAGAATKEPAVMHYHRPDNFSYTNLRKDFKSELGVQAFGGKKELLLLSKRPDAKPLAPIERDDWPGPPEPAAAYPELLRDKVSVSKSPSADEKQQLEDKRVSKEIDELSKMTDSGAAAVILRDLKKKRAESPTLDPRNSSMAPSAAVEPPRKPRYEKPFFASPSRNLDMKQHALLRERDRKSVNDSLISSSNFGGIVKPGYGLSILRPGSSFDTHNGYQSDGGEIEYRPKSSAGVLESFGFSVFNGRTESVEYDPTTGLRRSSHLKGSTLPQGIVSNRFLLDQPHLSSPGKWDTEPTKIFPYEQLAQKNFENCAGVNKDSLERHLSDSEFEQVFEMKPADFYSLPVWKRNEAKIRVGLL